MIAAPDFKDALRVSAILKSLAISNDDDLEHLADYAEKLDERIKGGEAELSALFDYIVERITQYEQHQEHPSATGVAVLRFLMDQHGHKLKDMTDIAPMSVISDVLNGKRELNKNHIEKLARKYNVNPGVFF